MAQVVITINRREYAIACGNGEELQIMKLGRMLDEKATALTSQLGQINETQLLAMVGLLIADELMEAKKSAQTTESKVTNEVPNEGLVNEKVLNNIDETFSSSIKSLNEAIKSIALNLKSL